MPNNELPAELQEEEIDETEELEDDGEQPEDSEEQPEKKAEGKPDDKEKNRKGYQMRQEKKQEASLSKDVESLKSTVSKMEEDNADLKWRLAHPNVTDELFNSIKSLAKGSSKSLDDAMNDPVIQSFIKTGEAKERISGATADPSTKVGGTSTSKYSEMTSEEFREAKNKVLGMH